MTKQKGSRYERELVHMFWKTGSWGSLRCPGSGSTPLPSPDILASNTKRWLAIECKAIKSTSKYFSGDEISQLTKFAKHFGAEPWIGIRFNQKGWYFLQPHKMQKTKNNFYAVTLPHAEKHGIPFQKLINKRGKK